MKRLLSLALALTLLVGCSSGQSAPASSGTTPGTNASQSTAPTATPAGKKVNLPVVWFSDGQEGAIFMSLAKEYEALNPGVTIELIETPYNDLVNKVKNMLAAGSPPAIARLSSFGEYKNQLVDLSQYASAGASFRDQFYNSLKFELDGKMLAAPMDVTANGLIYNKTAFDKAGVKVPQTPEEIWTWEEWETAMKTVMEKGGVKYGLVYDKSPFRFSTLLYQAGGGMLNEDLTASAFNSPENIRAVRFFCDLHKNGIIPDSVWLGSENPNNLFRTGQVAMHFGGSWLLTNYRNEITDFEWGVTYMPKDKQRSSVPGGKYICAFQGTGVEEEAVKFIEWLSQPEQNARYCVPNYFLSPVKGNEALEYDFGKEAFEIFANELAATSTRPGNEWGYQQFTALVSNNIRDMLAETISGKYTPEQYVAEVEKLSNEALKEIAG